MLTLTAPGDRQHTYGRSGEVCPCTPEGGVDLADWNPTCAGRWNHLRTLVRRDLAPDLEFMGAVEVQKRGALHRHVIVWTSQPLDVAQLRRLAIRCGFGHELDLAPITPGSRKHAYYVAKYVTKSCDASDSVPWRADVVDKQTGEIARLLTTPTHRNWSSSRGWGLTMADVRAASRKAVTAAQYHRAVTADVTEADAGGLPEVSIGAQPPPG